MIPTPRFLATLCAGLCLAVAIAKAQIDRDDTWLHSLSFREIKALENISIGSVQTLSEGPMGFIWIGTNHGLYRFDGYRLKKFQHRESDLASLANDNVWSVFTDSQQRMWFGTQTGISRYDPLTESFDNFLYQDSWPLGEFSNRINGIAETASGELVASAESGFIFRFLPDEEAFERINLTSIGVIKSMSCDPVGRIWVGYEDAVASYDPQNNKLSRFHLKPEESQSVALDFINAIHYLSDREIWVGTTNNGVATLDSITGEFTSIPHADSGENLVSQIIPVDPQTIAVVTNSSVAFYDTNGVPKYRLTHESNNGPVPVAGISGIYSDSYGNVWIASRFNGFFVSAAKKHFYNYRFHLTNPKAIADAPVSSFLKDSKQNIWVADPSSGLTLYPADSETPITFEHDPKNPRSLTPQPVLKIFEDSRGWIWIGSFRGGLQRFAPETGDFDSFEPDPNDPTKISGLDIRDFAEDEKGNLWIDTHGQGVDYLDIETGVFTNLRTTHNQPNDSIVDNWAYAILYDNQQRLWIGASLGISVLDTKTSEIRNYNSDTQNPTSLSSPTVKALLQDSRGRIWVGTENGLNRYDESIDGFVHYLPADGLPNQTIESIVEDDNGHLWLGTFNGLSQFDPETEHFDNYFSSDGLGSDEFFTGAAQKDTDGTLYFGHIRGLTRFDPSEIEKDHTAPTVIITDLLVYNEPLPIDPNSDEPGTLTQSIHYTDALTLKSDQKVLTFEFTALNFNQWGKNLYSFKLEGFDSEWSPPSPQRSTTYTNLNPGQYTFRVRASNNDGHWTDSEASLALQVLPPFWGTLWFQLSLLATLIVAPAAIVYRRNLAVQKAKLALETAVTDRTQELNTANHKLALAYKEILDYKQGLEATVKARTAELEVAKAEAEKSDRLKSAFLANMSHEIRTPMNAIVGFLQFLETDDLPPEERQRLRRIINQSSATLLDLIDDILDLSTIEAGEADLEDQPTDLRALCEEIHSMLFQNAKRQSNTHLELDFDSSNAFPNKTPYLLCDPLRLKQVLINLLANAIKFTENGNIYFGCRFDLGTEPKVVFTVRDTGIGISSDQLPHIFDRFHKIEKRDQRKIYRGTGLGLTISKKLVELMNGSIDVSSVLGEGTEFTLTLPFVAADEAADPQPGNLGPDPYIGAPNFRNKTILVAEDEYPNFQYIEQTLRPTGINILWAENGANAIELFNKNSVDIVLLDLKMPILDGHHATRIIRESNPRIPIIIQSAHAMKGDIDTSLELGANYHLTKPFLPNQLLSLLASHLAVPQSSPSQIDTDS